MISKKLTNWFSLNDQIAAADAERRSWASASAALGFADLAYKVRHRLVLVPTEARSAIEKGLLIQSLSALNGVDDFDARSADELREELEGRTSEALQKLRRPAALRVQRAIRCAIPLIVVFVGSVLGVRAWMAERTNLLEGASWRASSAYPGETETGTIAARPTKRMFFSTNRESEPWLVIELKEPKQASELLVRNRSDCCEERSVPLIVEVSLDGKNYREVAREQHPFKTWNSSFAPTAVRYLRFRSLKKTLLHFRHVSLYAP